MNTYTISLSELDRTMLSLAGGKGANLGELAGIKGILVPNGFCITTEAYKKITGSHAALTDLLDKLSLLAPADFASISTIGKKIRLLIESIPIPHDIAAAIEVNLLLFDEHDAFAIRSSATAEDLPSASFAGQQDTFLNITGKESILLHTRKCWASLFTDRAIIYRMQNGIDHRAVQLAVVVQQMVFPQAAGILFTADPVTGNRKTISIDASFGLGEALVAGLVNADNYKVRDGEIVDKKISSKQLGIYAAKSGGTQQQPIEAWQQHTQTLADDQILTLARTGKSIEAHFNHPQDIEWCLADGLLHIVQSRPITTLFPIPETTDAGNRVYISVGHQQMMTNPMKPLGLSFFLMITPAPMRTAAGRLFVDITTYLTATESRQGVIDMLGKSDPLIKDALNTIASREGFLPPPQPTSGDQTAAWRNRQTAPVAVENDPGIVAGLIQRSEASIALLQQNIHGKTGTALFDFIAEDMVELKKILFDPESHRVFMAAMDASFWINDNMNAWLGEKNAADTLSQSVPNNITSAMGLALLDVADVIRPYPQLVAYLQTVTDDYFLEEMLRYEGGAEAQQAINNFLRKYGMRCVGEIDITTTRWAEKPSMLLPMIVSNIAHFTAGASGQKFEQGLQEALAKETELLARLQLLPGGEEKARETKEKIALVRNYIGYREYPKFGKVSRMYIYKQAIVAAATNMVKAGVLKEKEDVYWLSFEELRQLAGKGTVDYHLIQQRKEAYKLYDKLTPPRVITSDGEIITGTYQHANLPPNAIAGLPVSTGIVEGRARVIKRIEDANLQPGDILVTAFTDPSWTPLFVSIKGLVTEVGGLMTHGAVIAREYGLPAVVGVEHATKLIKDGQMIRVNGTDGWVELL